jgi:hypothetical protein
MFIQWYLTKELSKISERKLPPLATQTVIKALIVDSNLINGVITDSEGSIESFDKDSRQIE